MRCSTLVTGLALASPALAWSPFGNSAASVEAPAPVPASGPSSLTANDPFQPKAATPEAVPFDSVSSLYNQASATVSSAADQTATPRKKAPSVPTQPTWFNGAKPLASDPYEGYEIRLVKDHVVIRPALYYKELLAVIGVVLVGLVGAMNKNTNWGLAKKWMEKHVSVLEDSFAAVDTGSGRYLKEIDGTTYASWATGRTGIKALRITLRLRPRADIFVQLYEGIRKIIDFTYQSTQDLVQLEFLLPSTDNEEFILGVVDKSHMSALRQERWDINAFTTLNETKNVLPPNIALFTETNAITEQLLKNSEIGLGPWLTEGEGKEWFQSLVITDVATIDRPSDETLVSSKPLAKDRRMIMTLRLPPASRHAETVPALILAINLADALATGKIGLEQNAKLRKRRQEIVENSVKAYKTELADAAKEEAAKQKRELDEKKYNALSPEKQKKQDELEKKRLARKQQMRAASSGRKQ